MLEEMKLVGTEYPDDILNEIVERRLKKRDHEGSSDNRVSGHHSDDDERTGSVPDSLYVSE